MVGAKRESRGRGRRTAARPAFAPRPPAGRGSETETPNKKKRSERCGLKEPGGAAGNMRSGRTNTCAPARADTGYLEDQIAFGVLFLNFGAQTSPPFRALFLKILQDLENKRETRDSRKRARRARDAGGIGRRSHSRAGVGRVACGCGLRTHTGCTNTERSGLGPYAYSAGRGMRHLRGEVARSAGVGVARLAARLRCGAHLHTTPLLRCRHHRPPCSTSH